MPIDFNFSHSGPVILDGGLGTTLEQIFGLDISNTPLWSAKAIIEHPEVVIQSHLAFLRAGAEVISTCTYQCSRATFEKAALSARDAERAMSKSIELADKARQMFREEEEEERKVKNSNDPRGTVGVRDVRISLSLGPFGATLSPAQEFDGFYPPPYGPKAFSDSIRNATENTEETNCNTFGDDREAENESIRELARFHYERLKMVFEDEAAWERIDCLAFETVPLTREIVAIRRAVGMLNERIADSDTRRHSSTRSRESDVTKPWWISMVFPDGVFPEMTSRDGSARVSVRDVVSAATTTPSLALPRPSGLGINCTQAEYLPNLVSQFDDGLRKTLSLSEGSPHEQYSPLLVLYPNGGDVYDIETQTWIKRPGESSEKQWAEALRASCAQVPPSQVWSGVIVGGCCRTTPMHIRSLKETVLSDESWHP